MPKQITITLHDNGSFSTDATKYDGTEKEILALYDDLAFACGGSFVVEKHVHGAHGHHHGERERVKH